MQAELVKLFKNAWVCKFFFKMPTRTFLVCFFKQFSQFKNIPNIPNITKIDFFFHLLKMWCTLMVQSWEILQASTGFKFSFDAS